MTGRRSHGRLSALNGVVHQGRTTPAQAAGVTDRLWEIEDLVGLLGMS